MTTAMPMLVATKAVRIEVPVAAEAGTSVIVEGGVEVDAMGPSELAPDNKVVVAGEPTSAVVEAAVGEAVEALLPASHSWLWLAPILLVDLPCGQTMQLVVPGLLEYVLTGHASHTPGAAPYWPA